MDKLKKYPIPEEIVEFIHKSEAMWGLRDVYAKIPFGFSKAKKCALESEVCRTKFWRKVVEIYPELKGKKLAINPRDLFVWILDVSEGDWKKLYEEGGVIWTTKK